MGRKLPDHLFLHRKKAVNFSLNGTLADIDETTPDEPYHPAPVLIVELEEGVMVRVIAPCTAKTALGTHLVGRPARITGDCQMRMEPFVSSLVANTVDVAHLH